MNVTQMLDWLEKLTNNVTSVEGDECLGNLLRQ
jgi:hypothetical protein